MGIKLKKENGGRKYILFDANPENLKGCTKKEFEISRKNITDFIIQKNPLHSLKFLDK